MGPVSRTPFALSHHRLLSPTSRGPTFPSGVQSPMAPLSLEEPSYPCSQPLRYLGQPWLSSLAFYFMSPPPGILPPPFLLRKLYPPLNEKPTSCTLFPVVWNCHQNFSRSCSSSVWWMADCDPGHIQSLWAYNLARRFFRARNVELAFNKIKAIF